MDDRTFIRNKYTTVVTCPAGHTVLLINQDRQTEKYVGAFLTVEETEGLIAALQKNLEVAKAERDRDLSMTEEDKQRMIEEFSKRWFGEDYKSC